MKAYTGLTTAQAQEKLSRFGFNEISQLNKVSPLEILLRQISGNFVIFLLVIGAFTSFLVDEALTAYTIVAVIIMVTVVGFIQEFKAEKAIKALKKMVMPTTIVIRDGREQEIPAQELVPDDIVKLRTGEKIPADCQILEAANLTINEAMLTGESKEITKIPCRPGHKLKKLNQVFMGTTIMSGTGLASVLHTGMNTEFGKIAKLISTAEKELPLQKRVNQIAKKMALIALIVSSIVGFLMIVRAESLSYHTIVETLIVVIALSVSAFPEGFPMVLISTLGKGAYRMAAQNAIVNRMSIIETLGEVTVICSDKTGTITTGKMTVKQILIAGKSYEITDSILYKSKKIKLANHPQLYQLLQAALLCNEAVATKQENETIPTINGSPTESALLALGLKANLQKESFDFEKSADIPFSSARKLMTVIGKQDKQYQVFSKGAPEVVLKNCNFILKDGKTKRLSQKQKEVLIAQDKTLAQTGMRVLALATKTLPKLSLSQAEKSQTFLGFIALIDPPRKYVHKTIASCHKAGIAVKMITGDSPETAQRIAHQVGIKGEVLTGADLEQLSDTELEAMIAQTAIFSRVKPEHKIRIVAALKKQGEIVAMTGDGVNDAPAIKEAHVGIAMGKTGTDVSREAADLIIKDDNFSTIVKAIREGRTIFNNIQKFITYQLSCNSSELMIMFLAVVIGLPTPFLPLQILFMNLVTDNLPAITLGFNPASLDVMESKVKKHTGLLNRQLVKQLIIAATTMGGLTLLVFIFSLKIFDQGLVVARTTAMVTLIFFQILNAFNFRSFRYPMNHIPFLTNITLIYASAISVLLTIILIYSPLGQVFGTTQIELANWVFALFSSIFVVIVMDVYKKSQQIKILEAINKLGIKS
ncbi:cation-transporting P-type ATPase [Candidatus Beckwithbacteria bacterium]|nr:cation-transporting P-type ATPase [Candidatus Beckwithbacteria bacterium]